ncbi:hypothetical protein KF840_02415 [bacterium]|nr:hypothetical protein [bacterium]
MSGEPSNGSFAALRLGLIVLALQAVASPLPPTAEAGDAVCVGDCNRDRVVTVGELITGVNIALGSAPLDVCPAFDRDGGDGMVAIGELIAGVSNLLYGCGVAPPTAPPTATASATPVASATVTPVASATVTPAASDSPTPTPTRTTKPTTTATRTPTIPMSVCGGLVSPLPVLCNLTVLPNPVSRSGTIAFRFGVSDLNGDINRICIAITCAPLEPQQTCTALVPGNRLINSIQTTSPIAASPLPFGTCAAAVRASDAAGHLSNQITATFQVQ